MKYRPDGDRRDVLTQHNLHTVERILNKRGLWHSCASLSFVRMMYSHLEIMTVIARLSPTASGMNTVWDAKQTVPVSKLIKTFPWDTIVINCSFD